MPHLKYCSSRLHGRERGGEGGGPCPNCLTINVFTKAAQVAPIGWVRWGGEEITWKKTFLGGEWHTLIATSKFRDSIFPTDWLHSLSEWIKMNGCRAFTCNGYEKILFGMTVDSCQNLSLNPPTQYICQENIFAKGWPPKEKTSELKAKGWQKLHAKNFGFGRKLCKS